MVIISGVWAYFISGFLVGMVFMLFLSEFFEYRFLRWKEKYYKKLGLKKE